MGLLLLPQSGVSDSEMVQIHTNTLLKGCILWWSWKVGRVTVGYQEIYTPELEFFHLE